MYHVILIYAWIFCVVFNNLIIKFGYIKYHMETLKNKLKDIFYINHNNSLFMIIHLFSSSKRDHPYQT